MKPKKIIKHKITKKTCSIFSTEIQEVKRWVFICLFGIRKPEHFVVAQCMSLALRIS